MHIYERRGYCQPLAFLWNSFMHCSGGTANLVILIPMWEIIQRTLPLEPQQKL